MDEQKLQLIIMLLRTRSEVKHLENQAALEKREQVTAAKLNGEHLAFREAADLLQKYSDAGFIILDQGDTCSYAPVKDI